MNKKSLTIVFLLVAFLFASSLTFVNATTPSTVQGAWRGTSVPVLTNPERAGANTFGDVYNLGQYYTGDILGTFEQNFKIANHFKDPKLVDSYIEAGTPRNLWAINTFEWTQMVRTFTGTVKVDGVTYSGGFTMLLRATGTGNNIMPNSPWTLTGTWTIVEGTGGLAGLHGQGTWWHTNGSTAGLEYEGQVHIDP